MQLARSLFAYRTFGARNVSNICQYGKQSISKLVIDTKAFYTTGSILLSKPRPLPTYLSQVQPQQSYPPDLSITQRRHNNYNLITHSFFRHSSTFNDSLHVITGSSAWSWQRRAEFISVGGNGFVEAEIYNLISSDIGSISQAKEQISKEWYIKQDNQISQNVKNSNILLYLPPGPSLGPSCRNMKDEFNNLLSSLHKTTCQKPHGDMPIPTVVKINYRLSPFKDQIDAENDYRFPTPVHDVTIAFEWIQQNQRLIQLQGQNKSHESITNSEHETETETETDACISIYGRNIGGAMALTLALTNPNAVTAVAVLDPMVDWVSLEENIADPHLSDQLDQSGHETDPERVASASRKNKTSKTLRQKHNNNQTQARTAAAQALIEVRTSLFRTPSGFFDPFASPILFLRAPGRDTPHWKTTRPESEEQADMNKPDIGEAFGPYDDDWHVMNPDDGSASTKEMHVYKEEDLDIIAEAIGTDIALTSVDNNYPSNTISDLSYPELDHSFPSTTGLDRQDVSNHLQTYTDLSNLKIDTNIKPESTKSRDTEIKPVKRRKVLRRWPSVASSEEPMLPYIRVFSRPPVLFHDEQTNQGDTSNHEIDVAHVLYPQATEMVDVMQRACFWGREKSIAEDRVSLDTIDDLEEGFVNVNGKLQQAAAAAMYEDRVTKACNWLLKITNNS